jgi:hypothetical protein
MMLNRALLLGLVLTACTSATVEHQPQRAALQAEEAITAAEIHRHVAFLASDALRGRDTPSPGLEEAAGWIARHFEHYGLQPAGEEGWLQRYPYPLEGLDVRRALMDIAAGSTHSLEHGVDFFVEPGATPRQAVGAVYLGDVDGLERAARNGSLRDRVALVRLSGQAGPARGGLRLDAEARARVTRARASARDAQAAGLVFVLDPAVDPDLLAGLAATAQGPARVLGGRSADPGIAAFFITQRAGQRLFRMAGLDGLEQLRRPQVDRPVPLPGLTLRLAAPWRKLDDARPPNVVGVLPGSDPALRDSFVVLSAHMDHVGVGAPDATGDSIYNGADDNASGTAALVAIARAFASMGEAPRRSILFLAVSGEEKGLLGSRWFVDHPTVPLESIVANINLDMIGRNAPDSIVVIGQDYSSLGPLVRSVAAANPGIGLTVSDDLWPEQRFFFRSDHYSFAAREIPALFFFAGVHEDYHRPGDRVERLDLDKNARVARLAFLLAHEIANSTEAPAWTPQGLEQIRAMSRP